MHELSICRAIVDTVLAETKGLLSGERVEGVTVAVGALHRVVPDTLTFLYERMVAGTAVAGSHLALREVPVAVACRACGWRGPCEAPFFLCGGCGARGVAVERGRELALETIRVCEASDERHSRIS